MRVSGNNSFFTASDLTKLSGIKSNGALFRKLNVYVAKWNYLESKIITTKKNHLCRAYRMTEETLKEW
jgi:hypothetical protein